MTESFTHYHLPCSNYDDLDQMNFSMDVDDRFFFQKLKAGLNSELLNPSQQSISTILRVAQQRKVNGAPLK